MRATLNRCWCFWLIILINGPLSYGMDYDPDDIWSSILNMHTSISPISSPKKPSRTIKREEECGLPVMHAGPPYQYSNNTFLSAAVDMVHDNTWAPCYEELPENLPIDRVFRPQSNDYIAIKEDEKPQNVEAENHLNSCQWQGCAGGNEDAFSPHKNKIWQHIKKRHVVPLQIQSHGYTCKWLGCERDFPNKLLLDEHIQEKHLKVTFYQCDMCHNRFSSVRKLANHQQKSNHIAKTKTCDIVNCGKVFVDTKGLFNHVNKTHLDFAISKENSCTCPWALCENIFDKKTRLRDHLARDHIGYPHRQCPEPGCNFSAFNSDAVKNHRDIHHSAHQSMIQEEKPDNDSNTTQMTKLPASKTPIFDAAVACIILEQGVKAKPVKGPHFFSLYSFADFEKCIDTLNGQAIKKCTSGSRKPAITKYFKVSSYSMYVKKHKRDEFDKKIKTIKKSLYLMKLLAE